MEKHEYVPSLAHAGDCRVCGHVQESSLHDGVKNDVAALESALDALKINARRASYNSKWRHKKSGKLYELQHHILIESTLSPAVTYTAYGQASPIWCRPAAEFFDRFEAL